MATAELFPTVSLGASAGFQDPKLDNWFSSSSRTWSFGPSLQWTIFNSGANLYNIEIQRALTEQVFLAYQQTVLTALQDVENALIALAMEQEHRTSLVEAVAANRKAVDLATQLYTQGQTDFLNVLTAQRSLSLSEDALVQSNRTVSTDLVALYKALGGGWTETAKATTQATTQKSK